MIAQAMLKSFATPRIIPFFPAKSPISILLTLCETSARWPCQCNHQSRAEPFHAADRGCGRAPTAYGTTRPGGRVPVSRGPLRKTSKRPWTDLSFRSPRGTGSESRTVDHAPFAGS